MYMQLLIENLLIIDYNHKKNIEKLAEYAYQRYSDDDSEKVNIDTFKKDYQNKKTPVWWYTWESFLYRTLNLSLRTLDIEAMFYMAFFIRDLHEQIKSLHSELDFKKIPPQLYRGQRLDRNLVEKLINSKGGFFVFNSFLSTSEKKSVAQYFIDKDPGDDNRPSILFEIKMDPTKSSVPFASVEDLTAVKTENEYLFSIATVFRIDEITKIKENYWKVNLPSTKDTDDDLKRLINHTRISLGHGDAWHRLGQLMIKMNQFNKATEIYKMLIEKVDPNDKNENAFLRNQLGLVYKQQNKLEDAFLYYQEALDIYRNYMSETDSRLSSIYSNIGGILKKLGKSNEALKYYELVLKIDLAAPKPNQLEIAIDHNNIGSVFDDQGKYPEALESYEKALRIKKTYLPPNHSSLASTYSNMGSVYRKMENFTKALESFEETLKIQQKSLQPNHPSLIVTYGKLAAVFEDLHQYKQAVEYAKKAFDIAEKTYGRSHPEAEKRDRCLRELQLKL